jgi:uncharacterized protein (TIGR03083 family)
VKDTYAHLAGVAADVLAGGLDAPPDDETTARQVAERAARSLTEVLDEWDEAGPRLEAWCEALGRAAPVQIAIDIWSHEVDVRSALGESSPSGGAAERLLQRVVRRALWRGWPDTGVPPLRIVTEDDEWVAGGDEPVGALTTTWFELGRVMLGRRSPAQMATLDWGGTDPSPWIAAIPVFGPAETDVADSPRI